MLSRKIGLRRLIRRSSQSKLRGISFGHRKLILDRMQSIASRHAIKTSSASTLQKQSSVPTVDSSGTPGFKRKHSGSTAPSAPNGLPLHSKRDSAEREPKRKRLSNGPGMALGTLRDAGKSIANLVAEGGRAIENSIPKSAKKKRRSSAGELVQFYETPAQFCIRS